MIKQVIWKTSVSKASYKTETYLVQLLVQGDEWVVELRQHGSPNSKPETRAEGSGDNHEHARIRAERTADLLVHNLNPFKMPDFDGIDSIDNNPLKHRNIDVVR